MTNVVGDLLNRMYDRGTESIKLLSADPAHGMEGAVYIGLAASLATTVTGGALVFLITAAIFLFGWHALRFVIQYIR